MMALLHLVAQLAAGWLAGFGHPAAPAPVLAHPAPVEAPAPAVPPVVTPAPAAPAAPSSPVPPVQQPPVADDSGVGQLLCLPGEEWDGIRCVALQLPEETQGRAYG